MLQLHSSFIVLNFLAIVEKCVRKTYTQTDKHTMTTVCVWGSTHQGIKKYMVYRVHVHNHTAIIALRMRGVEQMYTQASMIRFNAIPNLALFD